MGTPLPSHRPPHQRLLVGLLTLVFAITASGWLTTGLAAQNQKKEEEEETTKGKKKPPKVDEDDPAKPKPKNGQRPKEVEEERPAKTRKVIPPVDDDDATPTKSPKPRPKLQAPPAPEAQMTIVQALAETKNPKLREFLTNLLVEHDNITVSTVGERARTYAILPLTTYYGTGEQKNFGHGYLDASTYDAKWKLSEHTTRFTSALRIQPYEEIVLDDVESFLKEDLSQLPPTNPRYLSRADMLKAADTVLGVAERFHAAALLDGRRIGDDWKPLGQRLHERLFEIQLQRLNAFAAAGDWDGAAGYARTLADAYRDAKARAEVAARLVKMINDEIGPNADHEHLREARQRLRLLEEILPGTESLRRISDNLRGQAQSLVERAKAARKANRPGEAAELMQLAADIYPSLPGLAGEIAQLNLDHPILRVAVRELPTSPIPGLATTDADLRAVELMYEGLMKMRAEPGVGQCYEPALAGAAPRLVPLGREFRIDPRATWSDGTPVTVGDVKATLRVMQKPDWPGYSPLWNKMIDDAEGGGDSFRLSLRLHQGYLDPLSLMTFKVMSQSVLRGPLGPNSPRVGSGPFQYLRPGDAAGNRRMMIFLASPAYASREGRLGLPRIREVHMVQFAGPADDPVAELAKPGGGNIDMVLDVPAAAAKRLGGADGVEVSKPMVSRRVYFLAVNHRVSSLSGNKELRQALALAIDRQAILDKAFRAEPGQQLHHALNGPFPAGSWPCAPNVPAELYNAVDAKTQARTAIEQARGPIKLKLLYPTGEPATEAAMKELVGRVNQELRLDDRRYIQLELEGLPPQNLRERVEREHNYQLAYYHYDHPSEAYWLAPLFDLAATEPNGSNYMGYLDTDLQSMFAQAKNHRDFNEVRKAMHLAHRRLALQMPLIPLWQLDTFIAYRKGLKPTAVDPIVIFNDVEHWSLDKR